MLRRGLFGSRSLARFLAGSDSATAGLTSDSTAKLPVFGAEFTAVLCTTMVSIAISLRFFARLAPAVSGSGATDAAVHNNAGKSRNLRRLGGAICTGTPKQVTNLCGFVCHRDRLEPGGQYHEETVPSRSQLPIQLGPGSRVFLDERCVQNHNGIRASSGTGMAS
jgi:hypothetical protein